MTQMMKWMGSIALDSIALGSIFQAALATPTPMTLQFPASDLTAKSAVESELDSEPKIAIAPFNKRLIGHWQVDRLLPFSFSVIFISDGSLYVLLPSYLSETFWNGAVASSFGSVSAYKFHYRLNPTTHPPPLDLIFPNSGETIKTIVEFVDDKRLRMELIGLRPGETRPTHFTTGNILLQKISDLTELPRNIDVLDPGDSQHSLQNPGSIERVVMDGSSVLFPIAEVMAEKFMEVTPSVAVTVVVSGTEGGFKKLCAGEIDISMAVRPVKLSEIERCRQNGIEYVELPVAFDALAVIVHPKNDFARCLTRNELKKMWEPEAEGTIARWQQIRSSFPDWPLTLYGPIVDSGTYDTFIEAVVGKAGKSRSDFIADYDDDVIVQRLYVSEGGLGFLDYVPYLMYQDKSKLVAIDNGDGRCILPSVETIVNGSYQPLSRPLFIYINTESLKKHAVKAFTQFKLAPENARLIEEAGYVPLPADLLKKVQYRFERGIAGSAFNGEPATGVRLIDRL